MLQFIGYEVKLVDSIAK